VATPLSPVQQVKMIILHQPISDEHRKSAVQHLDELLVQLAKPGGFAKLTTVQRKFLMGLILAAIVPADNRIRNIELERLQLMLKTNLHASHDVAMESLALAEYSKEQVINLDALAKALPDLLGIEDRCTLITGLWELALCDDELHAFEEKMVYKIADLSEVPRKKVAELMAKASSRI
jgi:uncharacterized tellurite resistance protein B-like protein